MSRSKYLAFVDLLGFSAMVIRDQNRARNVLSDFYNICYREFKKTPDIDVTLISDSLMAYSYSKIELFKGLCGVYRACLERNQYYDDLSCFFLAPRGGLSFGAVRLENRTEAPNIEKDFIISPALVHAAKVEASIKGGRLLVAEVNDLESQQSFTDLPVYLSSPFILWNNYRYFDALWFGSESESIAEKRNALFSQLEIADKLMSDNQQHQNGFIQHIQTYRVGLLSLAAIFDMNEDENWLYCRLDEYSDDKYWLIWLAVIEMLKLKNCGFVSPSLKSFYREKITTAGWQQLLQEINHEQNVELKNIVADFVSNII